MRVITISTDLERRQYKHLCASARDIMQRLQCSRRHAYNLLRRYAIAVIVDKDAPRAYKVMTRWDLEKEAQRVVRRGNPRWHDPAYQSELASRPRKKRRLTR